MKLHSEPDYRTADAVEQVDQERRQRMMFRFLLLTCVVCLVLGLMSLLLIDSYTIAYALLILALISLPRRCRISIERNPGWPVFWDSISPTVYVFNYWIHCNSRLDGSIQYHRNSLHGDFG